VPPPNYLEITFSKMSRRMLAGHRFCSSSTPLPFAVGFTSAVMSCWLLSADRHGGAVRSAAPKLVLPSASVPAATPAASKLDLLSASAPAIVHARDTLLHIPQYTHICREAAYSCLGVARLEAAVHCPPVQGGEALTGLQLNSAISDAFEKEQAIRRTAYWNEQVMGRGTSSGVARIDGWLEHGDAAATGTLMKLQSSTLGIRGHVAEIGVHHGKYLIWMALHLRMGERAAGFDLFELAQSENIDHSGSGNLASLRVNAAHYTAPGAVEALATNSLRLPLCFFQEQRLQGLVRFFSVDGGHFVDHAYEDCWSAWSALAPGGIISVDDFLHGVSVMQGTLRFLDANADARAFLVGPNKLFICHRDFYTTYFNAMAAALPTLPVGGHHTVEFGAAQQLVMMPSFALTLHGWFLKAVLEPEREVWHCSLLSHPYSPPVFNEMCELP
jgi:hypothetical protein